VFNVITRLVDWYRHRVALATGDLRKYVVAEKRVRLALALTVVAIPVAALLYMVTKELLIVLIASAILLGAPWLLLLDVELSARELGRGLEEEMPFLLVMAAGVASTGLELVEAVKNAVGSRAFKAFKALSERFYALSHLLGASEALRLLTRIVSGRVRMLIAEYSSSLSSGTALSWLRDRASDLVKTAGVEFERSMSMLIMVATTLSMVFSVMPSILASIGILYSVRIGEFSAPEVPGYLSGLPAVLAVIAAVLCIVLPGYPLPARVVIERKRLSMYRALFATGTLALATPLAPLAIAQNTEVFTALAKTGSIVAIVLGAPSFAETLKALLLPLDDIVEGMANHVRVYRSMLLYRSEKLESLLKKGSRPWLVEYLGEAVSFFRLVGDVNPAVFETFAAFVLEMQRCKKRALLYMITMVATVPIAPVLGVIALKLGQEVGVSTLPVLLGYTSALCYGYIASKVATGRNISTLLPGIATLIYAAML